MTNESESQGLSYKDAGVDIDAGNQLVDRIKGACRRTHGPQVLGGIGGFGALFACPQEGYQEPVLVSCTDGVGTKLKLAIDTGIHDGIGQDLVAMSVNDLIVCGAKPLFFLDYYATAKLDVDIAEVVINGIARGCELADTALIGGETAEMPGMYQQGDYDLAGFCVGMVDKPKIIDGSQVAVGDVLIGITSSGPHANGYSLIRKILEQENIDLNKDQQLAQALLAPTKIYVRPILELQKHINIKAMAHITGGGILENLPRVLGPHLAANIQLGSWQAPQVFTWLQEKGNIDITEMHRTFNCGLGMIVCVPAEQCEHAIDLLNQLGENASRIGEILSRAGKEEAVNLC